MNSNTSTSLPQRRERNSSIELLRIITMLLILFHHFAGHGGFHWESGVYTLPRYWYNFILMGGRAGINIFVMISGYFLISNNGPLFPLRKLLRVWGQVCFYSIGIYLVAAAVGITQPSGRGLIAACFPITLEAWWFASTYFVLYLLHPFLNRLLNSLDKANYQTLLLVGVFCWSVIPSVSAESYQGSNLMWFMTVYAIAGYVRKFGLNPRFTSAHYFFFTALFAVLTYLTSLIFDSFFFYSMEKLPVLLLSLSVFMAFESLDMKQNKWINLVASTTFAVYLIHDSNLLRSLLWVDLFKNSQYQDTWLLIPYSIGVVALVFTVCSVIDLIRQFLFEKAYLSLLNFCTEHLLKPISLFFGFCKKIVFGEQ